MTMTSQEILNQLNADLTAAEIALDRAREVAECWGFTKETKAAVGEAEVAHSRAYNNYFTAAELK